MRKIERVETSGSFWDSLSPYRDTAQYPKIRSQIAKFIRDLSKGEPVPDRGFKNPALKGIMHLKLPGGTAMFHTYPSDNVIRLCFVGDHSEYGFNGKHKGKEAVTAERIRNAGENPVKLSPDWSSLRWKAPQDILTSGDIPELDVQALYGLLEEIDIETLNWSKLGRYVKSNNLGDASDHMESWGEELLRAYEMIITEIEDRALRRRRHLEPDDMSGWLEM